MSDMLSKAREKLAGRILEDFKGKITGDFSDIVVGDNPENVYFVGKLLPNQESRDNMHGSDVFIESVGADFYIGEKDFGTAEITVFPRGDFYYRAYPTLEQQRAAILEEANEMYAGRYDSFRELLEAYDRDPNALKALKMRLVPVYKKVKIHQSSCSIQFRPADLMEEDGAYGYMDENHQQNSLLRDYIDDLQEQLNEDQDRYDYIVYESITVKDLRSEETLKNFIRKNAKQDGYNRQNWSIYIYAAVRKIKNRYLVSISLVNDSQVQSNAKTHQSNRKDKDKPSIETLFNSGIDIRMTGAEFDPIVLDYFLDDYKYPKEQMAVGSNCSISFDQASNTIKTEHLPTFVQKRLVTNDKLAVKFQDLIDEPIDTLKKIRRQMDTELKNWNRYYESRVPSLTPVGREKMKEEIAEFEREIKRFQFGMDVITNYPIVLKSFVKMNRSFLATSRKYSTWRLFQIVFIVSLIPDIVACDENIMTQDEKEKTSLGSVSLLYFPTGGGKTEAFLGVLVFNVFFDRYRGKAQGVTSILRYPLRLLSVQQVQRLANTLAQAELLRREDASIAGTEEFSLGYFVGDNNTPNKVSPQLVSDYRSMTQKEMDEKRIIDICPFCGRQTVHLKFDEDTYRLVHYCNNRDCKSGKALPIYMVDSEIYRYLPTAVISTVDKMAILGNNSNFRNLLRGGDWRCPRHGCTSSRRCQVDKNFCDVEVQYFEEVQMYDPAPTLFIQDELHLIRESLGTYASHYEGFLNYYVKNISPSRRKIKVIGATATISSYEAQITQLYGKDPLRFPCASPYPDKNFYSYIDQQDTQRQILGYAPYGKAIINSVVYSLKYMRQVVNAYLSSPSRVLDIEDIGITSEEDAKKILEDYWIFLEYNNVKRDGNNVEGALETPINVELTKEGIKPFITRKMTGDESFQDVREVLAQVENTTDVFGDLNLIVATSMISHGVDADRFNVMFFYGMPGNTAEYIQAYSRTGRKYSSIVVDIMRPSRETDQSYLKNFVKFHEYKDIMVESVPINRWATRAIDVTLPGIFTGLLLNQYDLEAQFAFGPLFYMKNIKKAIQAGMICQENVKEELYASYGCIAAGEVNDLGNQYRKSIRAFVEKIFSEITDRAWLDENIFSGFTMMGYHIMNSLRDTDADLLIELD